MNAKTEGLPLIDWSKAPEATHFTPKRDDSGFYCDVFWRFDPLRNAPTYAWQVADGGVMKHIRKPSFVSDLNATMITRPLQAWTGEGLPPIGTVCEWHGPNHDGPNGWVWGEGEVVGYSPCGLFVFMQAPSCWPTVNRITDCDFRPILTPEQIAAEERLAAINYMEIDAGLCATAFDGDPEVRVWIENLIDKGWRKPGPVES